jgi:hypothetical protein
MAMRAGGGAPGRKKDFKKVTDLEDARRKREDNIIELRKNKRDENLQKKRQVHLPSAGAGGGGPLGAAGGMAGAGGLSMDDAAGRAGSQHKVRGFALGVVVVAARRRRRRRRRRCRRSLLLLTRPLSLSLVNPQPPKPNQTEQQLDELPHMVRGVHSNNPEEVFLATQKFRKLLSIGES